MKATAWTKIPILQQASDEAAGRQHSWSFSGMLLAWSAGSSSTGCGRIQTTLLPFQVEVGSLFISCLMFFHEYWTGSRN